MNKSEARELLLKSDVKLHPMSWKDDYWVTLDKETLFSIDNRSDLANWNVFVDNEQFEIYREPKNQKVTHYRRKWHQYGFGDSINDQLDWSKSKEAFDKLYGNMDITSRSEEWEEKDFEIE